MTKKLYHLFIAVIIWAVSIAQIAYVQSTFLNQFFDIKFVSIIYIIAYLISFFAMNEYPNVIAKFNNLNTAVGIFLLEIVALLIFIFIPVPFFILIGFIIYVVCINLIYINFDIFLEAHTKNAETGRVRGAFFTIYNLGWVISPFISGVILKNFGFNWLFALVIILILPIILILLTSFKKFKNHYTHKHFKMTTTIKKLIRHPNLGKIFYVAFLLQIFYATMTIYTPIYLNRTIGLGWDQIGFIFTIMLLPFILLELPAGYLADKYIGEKEILSVGIIITAIASILIFFTTTKNLIIWALILFTSRVGASLIEIMRDTYFFKKVEVEEIGIINAFRSTMPLGYIFVTLISTIILYFLPIHYIFLILGFILLSGLYFSLTLKDTK